MLLAEASFKPVAQRAWHRDEVQGNDHQPGAAGVVQDESFGVELGRFALGDVGAAGISGHPHGLVGGDDSAGHAGFPSGLVRRSKQRENYQGNGETNEPGRHKKTLTSSGLDATEIKVSLVTSTPTSNHGASSMRRRLSDLLHGSLE